MFTRCGRKGPFTLNANVFVCVFENNGSRGIKTQMQRMGSVFILCINVSVTIDIMLKFDTNADVDFDLSVNGP